jgi:hypothetical protein
MLSFLLAAVASIAPVPADHPHTFLASVVGVPLKPGESIDSFLFKTWGVQFRAVCHIPPGWRIRAGGAATPDGVLEGEGSQGATWLNREGLGDLRGLVLIKLAAPVQYADKQLPDGVIPATFKGSARVQTADAERTVGLTAWNVQLKQATRCPACR